MRSWTPPSLEVRTGSDFAVTDLTDRVAEWLSGRGDGLCSVLAPHATAGLALLETGSGSEADAPAPHCRHCWPATTAGRTATGVPATAPITSCRWSSARP